MKGSGVKLIPVGNTINIFHPSSGDPPCWSGGSPGPGSNVASCRLSGGGPGVSSLSREAQLLSPRSPSGESQDTPRSAGSTVLPACPGSSSGYSSNGGGGGCLENLTRWLLHQSYFICFFLWRSSSSTLRPSELLALSLRENPDILGRKLICAAYVCDLILSFSTHSSWPPGQNVDGLLNRDFFSSA